MDVPFLETEFQDWEHAVQPIEDDFFRLRWPWSQKTDKGRIASAYLTYIIENYRRLPSIMVFLNTEALDKEPGHSSRKTVKTEHVEHLREVAKSSGYANMHCALRTGCRRDYLPNRKPADEFRTVEVALPTAWKNLFNNTEVPEKISSPCCSQFGVTRERVKKRPVEDYIRYWTWLHKTTMDDDTAGLTFEYLWHIIFGEKAQYCMELKPCTCEVYGRC
jgi:hypothetical protein